MHLLKAYCCVAFFMQRQKVACTCAGFEMHGPLSSLGPPTALSIPPQWGLQDMSLAPVPLMPSLAPEVDLLSSCQEAMGMPGNPTAPASSRSADIFGERLSHAI